MARKRILVLCAVALLAQGVTALSAQAGRNALRLFEDARYEAAKNSGLAAVKADSSDVDAWVAVAWSLLELGRWTDAAGQAKRGYEIARDPRLAQAEGEALFHLGRNEEAIRKLQEYIGVFSDTRRAGRSYYYIGEACIRLGKFTKADISLAAAVRYAPGNARWWARLGWAREQAGRKVQALAAYEEALAIDPRLTDATLGRMRVTGRR